MAKLPRYVRASMKASRTAYFHAVRTFIDTLERRHTLAAADRQAYLRALVAEGIVPRTLAFRAACGGTFHARPGDAEAAKRAAEVVPPYLIEAVRESARILTANGLLSLAAAAKARSGTGKPGPQPVPFRQGRTGK